MMCECGGTAMGMIVTVTLLYTVAITSMMLVTILDMKEVPGDNPVWNNITIASGLSMMGACVLGIHMIFVLGSYGESVGEKSVKGLLP